MTDDTKNRPNTSLPVLDKIRIQTPCPMNWDELEGDSSKRFCGHCQKNVHNFSEMEAGAVDQLLAREPSVCAMIQRRTDGSIVTKKTPSEARTTRRNWFGKLGALVASLVAILTLGGCREAGEEATGTVAPPSAAEAPVLLGEVDGSELGDVEIVQPELAAESVRTEEPVRLLGKVVNTASNSSKTD